MTKKAELIAPDAYPQMVTRTQARNFSRRLRSDAAEASAVRIIASAAEPMHKALLTYVETLETVGQDLNLLSDTAHEIKGFADTAGAAATARIADGLCRYLDECEALDTPPDASVVALHVSAIGRATRSTDAEARMSGAVARELATLAARKLAEIAFKKSG